MNSSILHLRGGQTDDDTEKRPSYTTTTTSTSAASNGINNSNKSAAFLFSQVYVSLSPACDDPALRSFALSLCKELCVRGLPSRVGSHTLVRGGEFGVVNAVGGRAGQDTTGDFSSGSTSRSSSGASSSSSAGSSSGKGARGGGRSSKGYSDQNTTLFDYGEFGHHSAPAAASGSSPSLLCAFVDAMAASRGQHAVSSSAASITEGRSAQIQQQQKQKSKGADSKHCTTKKKANSKKMSGEANVQSASVSLSACPQASFLPQVDPRTDAGRIGHHTHNNNDTTNNTASQRSRQFVIAPLPLTRKSTLAAAFVVGGASASSSTTTERTTEHPNQTNSNTSIDDADGLAAKGSSPNVTMPSQGRSLLSSRGRVALRSTPSPRKGVTACGELCPCPPPQLSPASGRGAHRYGANDVCATVRLAPAAPVASTVYVPVLDMSFSMAEDSIVELYYALKHALRNDNVPLIVPIIDLDWLTEAYRAVEAYEAEKRQEGSLLSLSVAVGGNTASSSEHYHPLLPPHRGERSHSQQQRHFDEQTQEQQQQQQQFHSTQANNARREAAGATNESATITKISPSVGRGDSGSTTPTSPAGATATKADTMMRSKHAASPITPLFSSPTTFAAMSSSTHTTMSTNTHTNNNMALSSDKKNDASSSMRGGGGGGGGAFSFHGYPNSSSSFFNSTPPPPPSSPSQSSQSPTNTAASTHSQSSPKKEMKRTAPTTTATTTVVEANLLAADFSSPPLSPSPIHMQHEQPEERQGQGDYATHLDNHARVAGRQRQQQATTTTTKMGHNRMNEMIKYTPYEITSIRRFISLVEAIRNACFVVELKGIRERGRGVVKINEEGGGGDGAVRDAPHEEGARQDEEGVEESGGVMSDIEEELRAEKEELETFFTPPTVVRDSYGTGRTTAGRDEAVDCYVLHNPKSVLLAAFQISNLVHQLGGGGGGEGTRGDSNDETKNVMNQQLETIDTDEMRAVAEGVADDVRRLFSSSSPIAGSNAFLTASFESLLFYRYAALGKKMNSGLLKRFYEGAGVRDDFLRNFMRKVGAGGGGGTASLLLLGDRSRRGGHESGLISSGSAGGTASTMSAAGSSFSSSGGFCRDVSLGHGQSVNVGGYLAASPLSEIRASTVFRRVTTLDLSFLLLGDVGLGVLASAALPYLASLRKVDLSGNNITNAGIALLVRQGQQTSDMLPFVASANATAAGAGDLLSFSSTPQKTETSTLHHNNGTSNNSRPASAKSKSLLASLVTEIASAQMAGSVHMMSKGLSFHPSLGSLNLSRNNISQPGVIDLFILATSNPLIVSINVAGNLLEKAAPTVSVHLAHRSNQGGVSKTKRANPENAIQPPPTSTCVWQRRLEAVLRGNRKALGRAYGETLSNETLVKRSCASQSSEKINNSTRSSPPQRDDGGPEEGRKIGESSGMRSTTINPAVARMLQNNALPSGLVGSPVAIRKHRTVEQQLPQLNEESEISRMRKNGHRTFSREKSRAKLETSSNAVVKCVGVSNAKLFIDWEYQPLIAWRGVRAIALSTQRARSSSPRTGGEGEARPISARLREAAISALFKREDGAEDTTHILVREAEDTTSEERTGAVSIGSAVRLPPPPPPPPPSSVSAEALIVKRDIFAAKLKVSRYISGLNLESTVMAKSLHASMIGGFGKKGAAVGAGGLITSKKKGARSPALSFHASPSLFAAAAAQGVGSGSALLGAAAGLTPSLSPSLVGAVGHPKQTIFVVEYVVEVVTLQNAQQHKQKDGSFADQQHRKQLNVLEARVIDDSVGSAASGGAMLFGSMRSNGNSNGFNNNNANTINNKLVSSSLRGGADLTTNTNTTTKADPIYLETVTFEELAALASLYEASSSTMLLDTLSIARNNGGSVRVALGGSQPLNNFPTAEVRTVGIAQSTPGVGIGGGGGATHGVASTAANDVNTTKSAGAQRAYVYVSPLSPREPHLNNNNNNTKGSAQESISSIKSIKSNTDSNGGVHTKKASGLLVGASSPLDDDGAGRRGFSVEEARNDRQPQLSHPTLLLSPLGNSDGKIEAASTSTQFCQPSSDPTRGTREAHLSHHEDGSGGGKNGRGGGGMSKGSFGGSPMTANSSSSSISLWRPASASGAGGGSKVNTSEGGTSIIRPRANDNNANVVDHNWNTSKEGKADRRNNNNNNNISNINTDTGTLPLSSSMSVPIGPYPLLMSTLELLLRKQTDIAHTTATAEGFMCGGIDSQQPRHIERLRQQFDYIAPHLKHDVMLKMRYTPLDSSDDDDDDEEDKKNKNSTNTNQKGGSESPAVNFPIRRQSNAEGVRTSRDRLRYRPSRQQPWRAPYFFECKATAITVPPPTSVPTSSPFSSSSYPYPYPHSAPMMMRPAPLTLPSSEEKSLSSAAERDERGGGRGRERCVWSTPSPSSPNSFGGLSSREVQTSNNDTIHTCKGAHHPYHYGDAKSNFPSPSPPLPTQQQPTLFSESTLPAILFTHRTLCQVTGANVAFFCGDLHDEVLHVLDLMGAKLTEAATGLMMLASQAMEASPPIPNITNNDGGALVGMVMMGGGDKGQQPYAHANRGVGGGDALVSNAAGTARGGGGGVGGRQRAVSFTESDKEEEHNRHSLAAFQEGANRVLALGEEEGEEEEEDYLLKDSPQQGRRRSSTATLTPSLSAVQRYQSLPIGGSLGTATPKTTTTKGRGGVGSNSTTAASTPSSSSGVVGGLSTVMTNTIDLSNSIALAGIVAAAEASSAASNTAVPIQRPPLLLPQYTVTPSSSLFSPNKKPFSNTTSNNAPPSNTNQSASAPNFQQQRYALGQRGGAQQKDNYNYDEPKTADYVSYADEGERGGEGSPDLSQLLSSCGGERYFTSPTFYPAIGRGGGGDKSSAESSASKASRTSAPNSSTPISPPPRTVFVPPSVDLLLPQQSTNESGTKTNNSNNPSNISRIRALQEQEFERARQRDAHAGLTRQTM